MKEYEEQPNFILALVTGLLTSLALVIVCAYITYYVQYQIGWMAVAVGYVISFIVRFLGKGRTQKFAILGAGLSLLACLLGNMFYIIVCIANQEKMAIFDVLQQIEIPVLLGFFKDTFHPKDLIFYGIAVYEGYTLSIFQPENQHSSTISV